MTEGKNIIQCSVCDAKETKKFWHKYTKKLDSNKKNFSFGVSSELIPSIDFVCDDCYPNFIEEYKKDEWLEEKVEIKE
jgi:hypothetical protein